MLPEEASWSPGFPQTAQLCRAPQIPAIDPEHPRRELAAKSAILSEVLQ